MRPKGEILKNHSDAPVFGRYKNSTGVGDDGPMKENRPGIGCIEARCHTQEGGLATSGSPEQNNSLNRCNGQ
jgi:hypothetical protein